MIDYTALLTAQIAGLTQAQTSLQHSLEQVTPLTRCDLHTYSLTELDAFEALTARFARISDVIIMKVFRLIERIELQDKGSIRDLIHYAEKLGLIKSSDDFIRMRELRNAIAHEYNSEDLVALFFEIKALTPILLTTIDTIIQYTADHYAIKVK